MPAKAKTIDSNVLKPTTFKEAAELAKKIATTHKKIADMTDQITVHKNRLCDISKGVFFTDLGAELDSEGNFVLTNHSEHVPALFGNHEYDAEKARVSINFKVSAKEIEEVEGKKAEKRLAEIFGDDYQKIFIEDEEYEVTSSPDQIRRNLDRRPELFDIFLKPNLPIEKLREMRAAFPGCFDLVVKDGAKYAEVHPEQVEKKVKVRLGTKFLEKAAKLTDDVLKEAKVFIVGYLSKNMNTAVVVGPKAKNGKA